MSFQIDGTLYPDIPPPLTVVSLEDKIDFLARVCSAWDFGLLPDTPTVNEIRQPSWQEVIEACRLLTSPAYHLLRRWHHLPALPYLGQQLAYIRDDPNLAYI